MFLESRVQCGVKLWSYGFTLFTTFSLPELQSQMSSIWNTDCLTSSPVICPSSPSCNCTAVLPFALFVQPMPALRISHKISQKTYGLACIRQNSICTKTLMFIDMGVKLELKLLWSQVFARQKFVTRLKPCNWLTSALICFAHFLQVSPETLQEIWTLLELF